jgi:hypothetical protein
MSKAEAEAELTGLKLHAENKSDEAAASKYFSRGPYLRQFIEELDSINEDAQATQGDIGLNKFCSSYNGVQQGHSVACGQYQSLLNVHGTNGKRAH